MYLTIFIDKENSKKLLKKKGYTILTVRRYLYNRGLNKKQVEDRFTDHFLRTQIALKNDQGNDLWKIFKTYLEMDIESIPHYWWWSASRKKVCNFWSLYQITGYGWGSDGQKRTTKYNYGGRIMPLVTRIAEVEDSICEDVSNFLKTRINNNKENG